MRFSLLAAALPCTLIAQAKLGSVEFPTSGPPAAQQHFITGVLWLHNFEYASALKEFTEAERLDPGFAMAYWGEAMTYTHPIWDEQDAAGGRAALAKLAPTPALRAAKAPTAREKAFLGAVEALYGAGPKAARDTAYEALMAAVARDYPQDVEAQLFYALALLGLSQGDRDIPTYLKAGAIAETALAHHPDHPGAAHYVIHSYDDPAHAQTALAAARAYSKIAPGAAHAQHMTSHIFLALGLWDDVVAANVVASGIVSHHPQMGPPGGMCGHYVEWLEYGYLQQGRPSEAERVMSSCWSATGPTGRTGRPMSYAMMRTAYFVDAHVWTGSWLAAEPASSSPVLRATLAFGSAYAAFRRGDRAALAQALGRLDSAASATDPDDRYTPILRLEAQAMHAAADRDTARALALAARAARADDSLPFPFGPPATFKPPHELSGDLLLSFGRADSARAEYQLALARTPRRPAVLLGLARACAASGRREEAATAYQQVLEVWHAADSSFVPLGEARKEAAHLAP